MYSSHLGAGAASLVLNLRLESVPRQAHSCCAHLQDGTVEPALLEASVNWEALHKPVKLRGFPVCLESPSAPTVLIGTGSQTALHMSSH